MGVFGRIWRLIKGWLLIGVEKAEDPEVDPMIERCVLQKKTLTATYNSDCLKLADCVVVDVQCDYSKNDLGHMRSGEVEMAALEATSTSPVRIWPRSCFE